MNVQRFAFILSLSLCAPSFAEATLPEKESAPVLRALPSPIGDNLHTEVYFFIKDALHKEGVILPKDRQKRLDQEIDIAQRKTGDKPLMADVAEGELAHLLMILRDHLRWCQEITLYQKNGVAIATSGQKKELTFNPERDLNVRLGFLTPDPKQDLGQKKLTTTEGSPYLEVTQAVHYHKDKDYASLSNNLNEEGATLIGFVSYLVDEQSFDAASKPSQS
ncbi:MAG: hypothetical protein H2057_00865 [Alphaproteobacteria bacterium]|nr:hypothetical protein [Alphaproteobacteria bacterium]